MKNLLKTIFWQLVTFVLVAASAFIVFLALFKLVHLEAHPEASPLHNIFVLGIVVLLGVAVPQLILLIMGWVNKAKRSQYHRIQSSLATVIILGGRFFSVPSGNALTDEQIDGVIGLILSFMVIQYIGLIVYFIVSSGRFVSKKIFKDDASVSDLAGFWDRIWAKCIDLAPILFICTIFMVLFSSIFPIQFNFCLLFGLFGIRYTNSLTSNAQATRGKKAAGIYVAQLENLRPITKRQAWARYLIMYLPFLMLSLSESSTFDAAIHQLTQIPDAQRDAGDALHEHMLQAYYLIMMASIAFTKNKQGFHDRLCKTRVLLGKPEIVIEAQPPAADAKPVSSLFSIKPPKPPVETLLSGTPGSIWARLGAKLLSGFIFCLMYWVINILISHILPYSIYRHFTSVSLALFAYTAYYAGWLISKAQATPEKKSLKLYIVRADNGQKITLLQALLRFLASDFPVLLLFWISAAEELGETYYTLLGLLTMLDTIYFIIMLAMMIFRKDRRGLHDFLAGTRVLRGTPETANPLPQMPPSDIFAIDAHSEHKKQKIALALIALIALAYFAYPQHHKDPVQNDFEVQKAAKWRHDAEAGDAKSQTMMGNMYFQGNYGGIEKDEAQAISWYKKAAAQNDLVAERALGNMYYAKDPTEAMKWLHLAADQGDAMAQFQLGAIYYEDDKGLKDLTQSLQWMQKAAEAGYPAAQTKLGNRYMSGEGVDKDEALAVKWWKEAADGGDKEAACNLSHAYENGVGGLPKDFIQLYKWFSISTSNGAKCYDNIEAVIVPMTQDERDVALRFAREWKPRIYHTSGQ